VSRDAPVDHWAEYVTAGFTYWPTDGDPVSVAPTDEGRIEGHFPFSRPASFVTAHNPGGPVIDAEDNDARHTALVAEIATRGWGWLPAVGGDPAGLHAEDGVLLLDVAPDDAVELGARFDQDAVYVWHADAIDLLACDGSRHDVLGWIATVGTTSLTRPAWEQ
jgi:hypothetical protein